MIGSISFNARVRISFVALQTSRYLPASRRSWREWQRDVKPGFGLVAVGASAMTSPMRAASTAGGEAAGGGESDEGGGGGEAASDIAAESPEAMRTPEQPRAAKVMMKRTDSCAV